MTPQELYKFINEHFSYEELALLCLELGKDIDDIQGNSKISKIRELIVVMDLRDKLPELEALCFQKRPLLFPDPPPSPKPPPTSPKASYQHARLDNIAIINLLLAAFPDGKALEDFCKRQFPKFMSSVSLNASQTTMARELTQYLMRRNRLPELLTLMEATYPTEFNKHGPYIRPKTAAASQQQGLKILSKVKKWLRNFRNKW